MARTVHPSKLSHASRSFSRQSHSTSNRPNPASAQPATSRPPRPSTSRPQPEAASAQTSRARRPTRASADDVAAPGQPNNNINNSGGARESDKKRGKRKATEVDDQQGDEEDEEADEEYVGGGGGKRARAHSATRPKTSRFVASFSRQVSRKAVTKTWRPLSYSAKLSIRDALQQSALDVLARLQLRDRAVVQGLLSRIEAEIDAELVVMVVPSSGLLSRPVGGADGARQVELLEEAEMRQRIVGWDHARVQENEAIRRLKRAIKVERGLLEDDEARLATFEDARVRVEKKEQKDVAKQLHPLVADLLAASATADDQALSARLLGRAAPSKRWISEASNIENFKRKRGLGGDEDDDDEPEEEYDPAKDVYLVELQARLAAPLAEVERAMGGLAAVRGVVDGAERAVVGLI